jgi:glycosyltransferase involved in cell wall biosynthesis
MRIAIDARELAGQPTGVGRFLGEILREWARMPEAAEHDFVFCAPADVRTRAGSQDSAYVRAEIIVEPGAGWLWEQRVLPRLAERANADVLFCPAYSGPIFGRTPIVVAIHDVSFAAHPEWFRWREGLRRRVLTRRSARRAARVITISEFSRREIMEHLGVPGSKVDVIYPGVWTVAPPPAETQREPIVLFVGSIFNRRHVPETIRALGRLARHRPEARLVIVGDNRTFPFIDLDAVIEDANARDLVSVRPYVADAELIDLYNRARAFVFLSAYEGFGLTPLEALSGGVPIVVLDTPVAREIYGAAAIYVARPDWRLVATALEAALFEESTRASILAEAPTVLARYSWRDCARRVLNVLVAAAHEPDNPQPH